MSPLASRRTLAAASSLVLAAIGLTGCISLPGGGGGSNSSDISKMKNIPESLKQDLISQLNSASGSEKKEILEKATALNNVVGTQLIAVDPSIASGQKYKLDPKGMVTVDKNEDVYLVMSGADYWRLGQDSYDLCVDQDCQYYSSGPSTPKATAQASSTCGPSRSTTPKSPTSPSSAASESASKQPAHRRTLPFRIDPLGANNVRILRSSIR